MAEGYAITKERKSIEDGGKTRQRDEGKEIFGQDAAKQQAVADTAPR